MFGWEFAPIYSGGLGVACAGLTKGLANKGVQVTFVIPKKNSDADTHVRLLSAEEIAGIKIFGINSPLTPYVTSGAYCKMRNKFSDLIYGENLFDEVHRYSEAAKKIAEQESFDVIHAHDWLTFQAGINAKKISKKPLVVHVHATEYDRTGGLGANPLVHDIEKKGLEAADKIIAVSNYTKNIIARDYGISPQKIEVVHNAVEFDNKFIERPRISDTDRIVLFLGRITIQKGPDYFVEMAKKVSDIMPNVKFVVAGSGDMEPRMIERAAELGIGDKMLFAGFLRGDDITRAYKMADVYVVPSVSEPFGITPLESIKNGTPVIISKTSGVSEVVNNMIKVDFWDIDRMTNAVVGVLKYPPLKQTMAEEGWKEVSKISWDKSAEKCIEVYNKILGGAV